MIIGIGTDLLRLDGIPASSLRAGDAFYEKMYTAREKLQAAQSPCEGDWLRRRFAAKEAVFKSLGLSGEHVRLSEIEILDDDRGAPFVSLAGDLKEHAVSSGIGRIHISISSDGDYALAYAVAERMP